MRLRFVLLLLCSVLLGISSAFAQKKIFATVNPNASAINGASEIYNPATGAITAAGSMNVAREQHMAVKLNSGKILFAGGYNNRYLKSMELYNPADGSFTATTDLISARSSAGAAVLRGGNILMAGGYNGEYLKSAEIYDPSSEKVTNTGEMNVERSNPTVTLVNNSVLVSGGFNGSFLNSMEVYYTTSSSFSYVSSLLVAREGHTATVLSDGTVLLVGGCKNSQSDKQVCDEFQSTAEIWNPSTNVNVMTKGELKTARANHTATLLPDGKVLISGGRNANSALSAAEVYDPATGLFTAVGDMNTARQGHVATSLGDGRVVISGGYSGQSLSSIETYYQGAFTLAPSTMSVRRYKHSATLLADGKILLVGGENKDLLMFDVNYRNTTDNVSPNIVFSSDSKTGFVAYAGSGTVLAFSTETGAEIKRIVTGGWPTFITPLLDGKTLAVVSTLDNKIFLIGMDSLALQATYSFNGIFGFGSILSLSPDGTTGYISSTDTGQVIKFDIATGQESGRLSGMTKPAQITVTKDGSTLLVVDTMSNELVFVDPGSMKVKYKFEAMELYAASNFTIFNKAVLNSDDSYGVIGSQDTGYGSSSAIFVFKTSTGEIVQTDFIGLTPGYTTLLPDGSAWLVLCSDGLSTVLTSDFDAGSWMPVYGSAPLESANLIVSADSKYAYYPSASKDLLLEQDLTTKGIIGAIQVGDSANAGLDQASAVALTPDAKAMAVLSFISNQIDLLNDSYLFKQTKFLSQSNTFTGLSLINLSGNLTKIKVTALQNSGVRFTGENLTNPYHLDLGPNEQRSIDIAQLFDLSDSTDQSGRLDVESDQPIVVSFSATGQVHSDFLSPYTSGFQPIPFTQNYHYQLHDFIVPEIPFDSGSTVEFNLVNPTYSPSGYELIHYGDDGSVIEDTEDKSIAAATREVKSLADMITTSHLGDVLFIGGASGSTTYNTSELFQANYFTDSASMWQSRRGQSATLLLSERILIAGGKSDATIYKTAEIYNPSANAYLKTPGTMKKARYRHTANLLYSGKVLIAGGQGSKSINDTAEIFDPETGGFSATISMSSPRDGHTATRLPNGDVLIVGGIDGYSISATAEVFDVAHSVFQETENDMSSGRVFHTAVLLPGGKVLIAGGFDGYNYLSTAELYDPSTGTFSQVSPMTTPRSGHTATLLPNGTVLIAGGLSSSGTLSSVEIFDPAINGFLLANSYMSSSRVWHTATLVPDILHDNELRVLLVGGYDGSSTLDDAEFYDPNTQLFSSVSGNMSSSRQNHVAVGLRTGQQGYLRIKSAVGLLLTEIYDHGGADSSINGIDMDKYVGIKKVYSPQFQISSDYETRLNLINGNENNVATVTLTLYSSNGTVMSAPVELVIPKSGQVKGNLWDLFSDNPALLNQTGWLEVASSVDQIVGIISFTNSDNDFLASFELSGTPLSHFVVPLVSEDVTFKTEIALLNSDEDTNAPSANVTLELWDVSGNKVASKLIALPARTRMFETMSSLFPGLAYRTCNVRVSSDRPIHSFAVLSDRLLRFVSAVPVVPYPEP